jgi:hypothetical protein
MRMPARRSQSGCRALSRTETALVSRAAERTCSAMGSGLATGRMRSGSRCAVGRRAAGAARGPAATPRPAATAPPHGRSPLWAAAAVVLPCLLLFAAATPAEASAPRGGTTTAARPSTAAVEAARRFLCPHGGAPMRGLRGRGRCRGGGGGAGLVGDDPAVRGWDSGLPPPLRTQAPCPEGTVVADAVARTDARRCLPR